LNAESISFALLTRKEIFKTKIDFGLNWFLFELNAKYIFWNFKIRQIFCWNLEIDKYSFKLNCKTSIRLSLALFTPSIFMILVLRKLVRYDFREKIILKYRVIWKILKFSFYSWCL
jgi:hypothetical protein